MSTSTPGPHAHKMYKSSFHWRSDSGELDVFEAARYFSDQIPSKQHAQRRSLDVPMMRNIPPEYHHIMIMDHHHHHQNNQVIENKKKFKDQPSSPGGRLASFLNSLFNQSHSKKKKKKPKSGPAFVVEDESPGGGAGGRRKRRSSISHFLSYSSSTEKIKSSNANANTPTKAYKISDHHPAGPINGKNYKITLVEEKLRIRNAGVSDKNLQSEERRLGENDEEGAESDSSSDLFDLPLNHDDLDFLSSGLPVYGTTHIDTIKHS